LASPEEGVQVLIHLGLTSSQAKVYMALVRSGICTAKAISKGSKVAREDIYRIMPKLQELNLVEKIIDAPAKYAAIPIEDAFTILLKSRDNATCRLRAKTNEIIQSFNGNVRTPFEEEEHEFVLIPTERAVVKRRQMIDSAQKRIDLITSWERFNQLNISCAASLTNALKRNVEMRVVIGNPADEKSMAELVRPWREKYQCFDARWTSGTPKAPLMLVDDQKVLLAKSATTGSEESPFLWTMNPPFVSVVRDHIEKIWLASTSLKIPP
jgi:sugar-specific transcriptional regulator TrmB